MLTTLRPIACFAIAAMAVSLATPCRAQTESGKHLLSANQLRECAQMVQTLRDDSTTLQNRHERLNQRRRELAQHRAQLESNENTDQSAWGRYNAHAAAFNDTMARLRHDIATLNAVQRAYDQNCANRPYRHSDFQDLPANLRQAMKAGLSGVQVPYIRDNPAQQ